MGNPDAACARDYRKLNADIAIGARAAAFYYFANISLRTARTLRISQSTGKFIDATDANALFSRDYREPYNIPAPV